MKTTETKFKKWKVYHRIAMRHLDKSIEFSTVNNWNFNIADKHYEMYLFWSRISDEVYDSNKWY